MAGKRALYQGCDNPVFHWDVKPPTWGHMVMHKDGMKVLVEAPALEAKPATIEFVASILRNVQKADTESIERRIRDAVRESEEKRQPYHQKKYTDLKKEVDDFEAASGIKLNEYCDGKELGEAVATLRSLKWRVDGIQSAIKSCEDIRCMLQKVTELSSLMPAEVST